MAQETIGMTPAAAASLVGIIGIFNGGGRIAWSTISDYLGEHKTYILFFYYTNHSHSTYLPKPIML